MSIPGLSGPVPNPMFDARYTQEGDASELNQPAGDISSIDSDSSNGADSVVFNERYYDSSDTDGESVDSNNRELGSISGSDKPSQPVLPARSWLCGEEIITEKEFRGSLQYEISALSSGFRTYNVECADERVDKFWRLHKGLSEEGEIFSPPFCMSPVFMQRAATPFASRSATREIATVSAEESPCKNPFAPDWDAEVAAEDGVHEIDPTSVVQLRLVSASKPPKGILKNRGEVSELRVEGPPSAIDAMTRRRNALSSAELVQDMTRERAKGVARIAAAAKLGRARRFDESNFGHASPPTRLEVPPLDLSIARGVSIVDAKKAVKGKPTVQRRDPFRIDTSAITQIKVRK